MPTKKGSRIWYKNTSVEESKIKQLANPEGKSEFPYAIVGTDYDIERIQKREFQIREAHKLPHSPEPKIPEKRTIKRDEKQFPTEQFIEEHIFNPKNIEERQKLLRYYLVDCVEGIRRDFLVAFYNALLEHIDRLEKRKLKLK